MEKWTAEEVENLIEMLFSADEKNVLLAMELIQNRADVEPFIEHLSLILLVEYDWDISSKAADLLMNAANAEKVKEVDAILSVLKNEWDYEDGEEHEEENFYKSLRLYEKHIDKYESFFKKKTKYVHVYDNIIYYLEDYGKKEWALKYLKKITEIRSDYAPAHFDYAYTLSNSLGNEDEVIYHYERCVALGLSDKAVKHNLACQYNQKKFNHKKAIELLEDNLTNYPDFVESMLELSSAYRSEGQFVRAKDLLFRAIELEPDYDAAYNNLAFLYWSSLAEYEEAFQYIKKALELNPDRGLYWHTLAEVEWYGYQNKEKALAALYKAMEVESSYTDALGMIKEIENQ